jgi:PiT family inorganic phosphate transporter
MWRLISAIFLGSGLGANDTANIFGPAVTSGIIKYFYAVIITSIGVILGSMLEGSKTFAVIGNLFSMNVEMAFFASAGAAISVIIFTYLKLPISTSQAIVGGILGVGILTGSKLELCNLIKIIICWVTTPVGGIIIGYTLYSIVIYIFKRVKYGIKTYTTIIRIGVIISGFLGAYSLGCNNVGNVTGIFVTSGMITPFMGTLIGGLSITIGCIGFSKRVMITVGKRITNLDYMMALVAVIAEAITVYIYTQIGVPVSTSQAIVGAIIGIGLTRGVKLINFKVIFNIVAGWIFTPIISILFTIILATIF